MEQKPDGPIVIADRRTAVLMIGPLPPPRGGVANFVEKVRDGFPSEGRYEIEVYRTGPAGERPSTSTLFIQDLRDVLRYFRRSRKGRPQIVHVHTASYYSFLRNVPYVMWSKHISRVRTVVHVHGGGFIEFYQNGSATVKYLVRRTLQETNAIIVTSPSWIKAFQDIAGPDKKIVSVPNGFDPRTFRPIERGEARKEAGIPPEGRVLVTVGYLEEVKGHRYLIEAMREVAAQHQDVRLYIIGNGSLRDALAEQVKKLGLEDRVHFLYDPITSAQVADWMNAADIFVLPSLKEGNPTVMFECLGCGRPFIGTWVGGIPDVITGEMGVLCEPSDPHGLALAINEALGREWSVERISQHAQRYTWTNIVSQLSALYDEIMGRETKD
ncbi:MAG: glycosyltransferase family 4 protein [Methanomassiliicoccus sp.]|nr:glycosyltransferase family 4 protein [Methanomassiliicoccus sp.]